MAKKKATASRKLSKPTKKRQSKKAVQDALVANMQEWRKIENQSVASTGRVMEQTENPIVRLVMEIIQRDSQMHHRVQEWIADSLTIRLSPPLLAARRQNRPVTIRRWMWCA